MSVTSASEVRSPLISSSEISACSAAVPSPLRPAARGRRCGPARPRAIRNPASVDGRARSASARVGLLRRRHGRTWRPCNPRAMAAQARPRASMSWPKHSTSARRAANSCNPFWDHKEVYWCKPAGTRRGRPAVTSGTVPLGRGDDHHQAERLGRARAVAELLFADAERVALAAQAGSLVPRTHPGSHKPGAHERTPGEPERRQDSPSRHASAESAARDR
jgi:hypothetical protein